MTISEHQIKDYTLWQEIKENDNDQARQKMIIDHLPLVRYHAGRIKMLIPDFIEEDDLESYGTIGLIDAIQKFNHQQGTSFSSYASRRIRGEIIDYLRSLDWLPHSLRREGKKLKAEADRLSDKLGRKPTLDELAESLQIPRQKVDKIYSQLYAANWISLYSPVGDDSNLLDFLVDDNNQSPDALFHQKEREELLVEAIDRLKESERLVISLYYYEGLTQKEITEVTGFSAARVSQLHSKAIYRLRGILGRKKEQLI